MSRPVTQPLDPAPRLVAAMSARCNNACHFCDRVGLLGGSAGGDVGGGSAAERAWGRALDAARGQGVVVLSGGEPTLDPDIARRVAALRGAGAREVWIQTNGRMLAYRKFARSLVEAGATGVECAIHGHEPALHDWLTRVDGSFRQAVRGAKNARRAGLRLVINAVVVRSNFRHTPALVSLCRRLGAERIRLHPVRREGAVLQAGAALVPPPWLAGRYVDEARQRAAGAGIALEVAGPWAGQEA